MASIVITAIGDDRAGLVEALSGAIARHGGNWDRSHMAELAGKFAGIVLVTVPATNASALMADLDELETHGMLEITAEQAAPDQGGQDVQRCSLELVGQDHPGIVHEVSHVLAGRNVSIDELETEVTPAPQGGQARPQLPKRGTTSIQAVSEMRAVVRKYEQEEAM